MAAGGSGSGAAAGAPARPAARATPRTAARGVDLSPFVPRLVADWVRDTPDAGHRAIPGTMVFTDLSGFTAMSEKLATLGKLGAEELTEHLDTTFSHLLDVAGDYGGSLLKFGGDALLLFFWDDCHAARGARACTEMQRRLGEVGLISTSAGRVRLRMSVGAHTGSFDFFLVGQSHRELFVCGPAATTTVQMESAADAGEVLLSPELAAEVEPLAPGLLGATKGPGVLLAKSPPAEEVGPGSVRWPRGTSAADFVPRLLRDELASGVVLNEHRQLVMSFLHLANVDHLLATEGSTAAAARLHGFVAETQDVLDRHGVAFNATDIYDDGPKILANTGAPRAWEDDDERMLRAMREVLEAAPDHGIVVRIGVNRGHGYAGQIGPPYRRNYVTMGDVTNTAARVMSKAAPGQLLSTAGALKRSDARFEVTELRPFAAKGKAKPLVAFDVGRLLGSKGRATSHRAHLVGRHHEMEWLEAHLHRARDGAGALVELAGDAGIGKSRLLDELTTVAGRHDVAVTRSACSRYTAATPYLAVRPLLVGALGGAAPGGLDPEAALRQVVAERAPHLEPWLALLGLPLGLDLPAGPEVAGLDERTVRRRLHQVVSDLVGVAVDRPALWLVDDAQWIDDASAGLLAAVGPALGRVPLLVAAAHRPDDAPLAGRGADRLELEGLDNSAATALARAVASRPLLPQRIDALLARAGGNPMFVEELAAALTDVEGEQLDSDAGPLPDTVEGLVAARIDSLSPAGRRAVRQLAVLGMATEVDTARAVVDDLPPGTDLGAWRELSRFVDLHDGEIRFRHALARDVAYAGLTFRKRRQLHLAAGRYLEAALDPGRVPVDLLAVHFGEAGDHRRAWRYGREAGERAWSSYAFATAADHLERAVLAARIGRIAEPSQIGEVLNLYGRALVWTGRLDDAAAAFSRARRLMKDDAVTRGQLALRQGLLRERTGRYDLARRWYRRGLRELEGCTDAAALPVRVRLSTAIGFLLYRSGRPADAMPWLEQARQAAGDPSTVADPDLRKHLTSALAQALSALHMAGMALGDPDRSTHAERALELLEAAGDRLELANVLNNVAMDAHLAERWPEAADRYRQALENQRQVGAVTEAAVTESNLGEILSDQGRWEEAEELFRSALDTLEAAGSWMAALARANLGRVLARQGRTTDGMALLEAAHARLTEVGAADFATDAAQFLAEAALLAGDPARSLCVLDEHLADPDAGHRSAAARLRGLALLGRVRAAAGDAAEGRRLLEEALDHARAAGSAHQEALARHALAGTTAGATADDERERHQRELAPLLARLGIERLPELPDQAVLVS